MKVSLSERPRLVYTSGYSVSRLRVVHMCIALCRSCQIWIGMSKMVRDLWQISIDYGDVEVCLPRLSAEVRM